MDEPATSNFRSDISIIFELPPPPDKHNTSYKKLFFRSQTCNWEFI